MPASAVNPHVSFGAGGGAHGVPGVHRLRPRRKFGVVVAAEEAGPGGEVGGDVRRDDPPGVDLPGLGPLRSPMALAVRTPTVLTLACSRCRMSLMLVAPRATAAIETTSMPRSIIGDVRFPFSARDSRLVRPVWSAALRSRTGGMGHQALSVRGDLQGIVSPVMRHGEKRSRSVDYKDVAGCTFLRGTLFRVVLVMRRGRVARWCRRRSG